MVDLVGDAEDHKTLGKGTFWQFASFLLVKLLSIVFSILMARLFAKDDVGAFYVAFSAISLVTIFSDLGLSNILQVYVPHYMGKGQPNAVKKLLKLTFKIGLAVAFIISAIVFIFAEQMVAFVNGGASASVFRIFSIYFLLNAVFSMGQNAVIGFKQPRQAAVGMSSQLVFRLLLLPVFLMLMGSNAESLSAIFVVSFGVGSIITFYYLYKAAKELPESKDAKDIFSENQIFNEFFAFGAASFAGVILNTIFSFSDRIFLTHFLPANAGIGEIAVYSIALGLATTFQMFSSSIGAIFVPIISHIHGKGERVSEKINEITNTALKWSLIIAVPFFVFAIIFAQDIMSILYGEGYSSGGDALAMLSIGFVVFTLGYHQRNVFAAIKRADIGTKIMLVSLIANVISNIILIPIYGITGAAISFAVFYLVSLLLTHIYSIKLFEFRFSQAIVILMALFLIMLAAAYLARPYILNISSFIVSVAGSFHILANALRFIQLGAILLLFYITYFVVAIPLKLLEKKELDMVAGGMEKARVPKQAINIINKLLHH